MLTNEMSDKAILKELGSRISRYRLNKNMTQQALATEAGVSMPTIQRLEKGTTIQLFLLIRTLRTLNIVENLESFIPEPAFSPLQQLKMRGKIRQRAGQSKKKKKKKDWQWGDN